MLKQFILLNFFYIPFVFLGQFSIDLNQKEINFCNTNLGYFPSPLSNNYDSIGARLKIYNGVPPYTFKWIINDSSLFFNKRVFTASTYLHDTISQITRIRKDSLIASMNDTVVVYLIVTDSTNRIAKDSLIITISQFKKSDQFLSLCYNIDTNKISAVIGGTFIGDKYRYKWTPKDYLLDDTIKVVRTLTKVPITYVCEITNKFQCRDSTFVKVIDFDNYCANQIYEMSETLLIENFKNIINDNTEFDFIDEYEHKI
ncbi:MAG: hypothetical protein MUE72_11920 [Chitinophagaceae bacterium]|nr:hypothetical protein [Chitinophagaceae bacterium]